MTDSHETPRQLLDKQVRAMEAERQPLDSLYVDLRDNFLPGRGRFHNESAQQQKAPRVRLTTTAPVKAAETLGSGLHAGLTSPARPWLKSSIADDDLAEYGPVKRWLGIVDERMLMFFARSNLYQALPSMYEEFGTFGTMAALAFEDEQKLFRFEPYTVGSYWLGMDGTGGYDRMTRVMQMTVRQIVSRWGERALTPRLLEKYRRADQRDSKVAVRHFVEPVGDGTWRSCYYDDAGRSDEKGGLLFDGRFRSNAILAASWNTLWGDTYACSCPGFTGLGPAKALQVDTREKGRAIQKAYDPPLYGPTMDVSLAPGAYNPIPMDQMQAGAAGLKIGSVYDMAPDIRGLLDNTQASAREVRELFFVDLFLMLTLDERNQRATAEEIRAKYDEKVLALGPTLERANAMLRGLHGWAFDVMVARSQAVWEGRMGGEPILPEPPRELREFGVEIVPEFISALQMAQRAQRLQGIERFMSMAGQMAQLTGGLSDKVNADQVLDEYGAGLGVPAGIINDDETVDAMRQAQAEQQQMQQMAAMAPALKQGAEAVAGLAQTTPADNNLLAALGQGVAGSAVLP